MRLASIVFSLVCLACGGSIHRAGIVTPDPFPPALRRPPYDFRWEDLAYPDRPLQEARLLKLHLVRPDLIPFPLDTRYYA